VEGGFACVGIGTRLVVLDVADPADLAVVGQAPSLPGQLYDVAVVGSLVYVAHTEAPSIVDLSSPSGPRDIGYYETPVHAWGVAVVAGTPPAERRCQVAASQRDMLALLNSPGPTSEILDHIVMEAGRLLGSETSAVCHWEPAGRARRMLAARGASSALVADLAVRQELLQALLDGRPWLWADPEPPAAAASEAQAGPSGGLERLSACCRALLAVPLGVTGEPYGSLVLFYSDLHPFTEDEVSLAMAFGGQVGIGGTAQRAVPSF